MTVFSLTVAHKHTVGCFGLYLSQLSMFYLHTHTHTGSVGGWCHVFTLRECRRAWHCQTKTGMLQVCEIKRRGEADKRPLLCQTKPKQRWLFLKPWPERKKPGDNDEVPWDSFNPSFSLFCFSSVSGEPKAHFSFCLEAPYKLWVLVADIKLWLT